VKVSTERQTCGLTRLGNLEFERGGVDRGGVFLADLADFDEQEGRRLVDVDHAFPREDDSPRQ
jgi:hypothetical protein